MLGLVSLPNSPSKYFSEFVEVDPTGRYGRYNEVLGKGASKTVYRAFDEYEGIEVAWNQVKLYDFLQSPEDLERLYCEIHLLKTLKHKNIMKFYTSWVDTANRNINFVTEMFTSGTLRQYRLKHKKVNIRAVKHWCRQILEGLLYLHSHDPPVIHRDLKCDNIFVNGNQGEVKIGDLGLAAILQKSHADHCVGTPEFMAPEVYEEAYNELVDIYSFGMCILEMVTIEYPYSECTHPAQIYKKVISGKKPDALYKVKDPEVKQFVEKCLATVSCRLSAWELLEDPFLRIDDQSDSDLRSLDYGREVTMGYLLRQPHLEAHEGFKSYFNGYSNGYCYEAHNDWEYHPVEVESSGLELFEYHDDDHCANLDISIKGKLSDKGGIFLRLRIPDKEGHIRNIYFPFDIETDTALSVATEMVAELDITDQDVIKIADTIDGEIASLVPEWRTGLSIEETPHQANQNLCNNCVSTRTSNGSLADYMSSNACCRHGCASMHGRFEEITFLADEHTQHLVENDKNIGYQENWVQQEGRQITPVGSRRSHSDKESENFEPSIPENDDKGVKLENGILSSSQNDSLEHLGFSDSFSRFSLDDNLSVNDQENENQQELRWLKAKYQMELREVRDQQLCLDSRASTSGSGEVPSQTLLSLFRDEKDSNSNISESLAGDKHHSDALGIQIPKNSPGSDNKKARSHKKKKESLRANCMTTAKTYYASALFSHSKHCDDTLDVQIPNNCPRLDNQKARNRKAKNEPQRANNMVTAKSYFSSSFLPQSLHRTTSLPVDAVDV